MAAAAVYYETENWVSGRERYGYRLRPIPNEDLAVCSKPIDNSRVARQPDSSEHTSVVKFFGVAIAVAVFLAGILAPHAWSVVAGIRYQGLLQERERLANESVRLEVEEATLLSTENLLKWAAERSFEAPAPGRVVYLDGKPALSADRR